MATTTFALDCPAGSWTLVAAGDTYEKLGIQIASTIPCEIAIAANSGAIVEGAAILLHNGWDRTFSLDLTSEDSVFARGLGGTSQLRGYRTTVA